MERVETLLKKLNNQISGKEPVQDILLTVQMLQSELQHVMQSSPDAGKKVLQAAVHLAPVKEAAEISPQKADKIVEVLEVNEADLQAELEEIKKNAEAKVQMATVNKPTFDPMEDTPTLVHHQPRQPATPPPPPQPETDGSSLNEKLRKSQVELGDALSETAIKDLRKAIGLNERFLFINELFRGDEVMYERSIKTINSFAIYAEAEYWIKRELKLKLGWMETNPITRQFDQLVRRRFA